MDPLKNDNEFIPRITTYFDHTLMCIDYIHGHSEKAAVFLRRDEVLGIHRELQAEEGNGEKIKGLYCQVLLLLGT